MTGRLMLVGRDWGYHEHIAKKPFIGPAGGLLNRGLKNAHIDREQCVVTNVVSAKPPHDEWKMHSAGAVAAGVKALHALCYREEPALIVAFGEHALHALIAGDPDAAQYRITEVRGYCFKSPFGSVLACTHPAFILRNWHPWWALFTLDLQKARRVYSEALHGGWKGGASAERHSFTEKVWTETLNGKLWERWDKPIAIDIETGGELEILCMGWATSENVGHCAPYREDNVPWFRALLANKAPKVFQNGQFDVTILERNGFEVYNWQHDTMLQWATLEPLLAGKVVFGEDGNSGAKQTHKSLRFLASIMTDEPFYKNYSFTSEMDRYILCAKDARITLEVYQKMSEKLLGAGTDL